MTQSIFVISDLHLGGAPASADSPSFQMCSAEGRKHLAAFLTWVKERKSAQRDVHLVIAGDIVDFLAEKDQYHAFSAFTEDQKVADWKLTNIMDNTLEVWRGLADVVKQGCALTLMLGNHDIELSLPQVRRHLLDTIGPGRIDFLYDNEAFTLGDLLIEHGNRYDGFNVVAYDSLRRLRSSLSRRGQPERFPAQPGSDLVFKVMNPIKQKFAFVDLLKPETSAVLPILAALDPQVWRSTGRAVYDAALAAWRQSQYDAEGQPTSSEFIAAVKNQGTPGTTAKSTELIAGSATADSASQGYDEAFPDSRQFALADELAKAYGPLPSQEIAGILSTLAARVKAAVEGVEIKILYKAMCAWAANDTKTFDIGQESKTYLTPATTLAKRGFKVVVNGHTHIAKRVPIPEHGATYLNTGTWADLMRIPPAVLDPRNAEAGQSSLKQLLEDLKNNKIDGLRRPVPTFAWIEVDNDQVISADVHFFDPSGETPSLSTDGLLSRLDLRAQG